MKSWLDLGFVAQPRNRPLTSSCCSCHHAARTRPLWPPSPSNESYLSSPHVEASPATTFRACSSPAPTRVKPQPAPAILSQESVHTTLSITHHTRKRPSTGPRTTHGPHSLSPVRRRRAVRGLPSSDLDWAVQITCDPGQYWSTRRAAPIGDPSRRIVIQRIRSIPRLDLGGFAKETLLFLRFKTRSFHLIGFLTNRFCFLRFSPGSMVFFSD
jgi:hypothetical protein